MVRYRSSSAPAAATGPSSALATPGSSSARKISASSSSSTASSSFRPALVEDLQAVVVGRVVGRGHHDPGRELGLAGDGTPGRGSAGRPPRGRRRRAPSPRRDRGHEHVAGSRVSWPTTSARPGPTADAPSRGRRSTRAAGGDPRWRRRGSRPCRTGAPSRATPRGEDGRFGRGGGLRRGRRTSRRSPDAGGTLSPGAMARGAASAEELGGGVAASPSNTVTRAGLTAISSVADGDNDRRRRRASRRPGPPRRSRREGGRVDGIERHVAATEGRRRAVDAEGVRAARLGADDDQPGRSCGVDSVARRSRSRRRCPHRPASRGWQVRRPTAPRIDDALVTSTGCVCTDVDPARVLASPVTVATRRA